MSGKKEKDETYNYGAYLNRGLGRFDPWTSWFKYYNDMMLKMFKGNKNEK